MAVADGLVLVNLGDEGDGLGPAGDHLSKGLGGCLDAVCKLLEHSVELVFLAAHTTHVRS